MEHILMEHIHVLMEHILGTVFLQILGKPTLFLLSKNN